MARLPRYQRIGLTARQPVSLDFAAAREEARLGQTISQQLDRMSEFAFRRAAEEAERRGEERVREEGALPTLEAIRERGGPRGIAERAAVEAANRIAVVEIETLAKQDMQNLIREADKNNMPLSAFEASMADIQDGYAASLEEIDPVASGVLSARLNDSAMTYTGRYSDISFRKAQAAAQERASQIVEVGSQEIIELATQPGSNKATLEVAAGKFKANMLDIGVSEEKSQKVIDQTLKKAVKLNRLYLYDNADGISKKKELVEVYKKFPLPGADYEESRSFNDKLERYLSTEINVAQKEFASELKDAETVLRQGGFVPSGFEMNEEYIRDIFDDETASEILRDWQGVQDDVANIGALNEAYPEKIDAISSEYEDALNNAIDSGDAQEIIKASKRILDWQESVEARDNAISQDAAAYVISTSDTAQGVYRDIQEKLSEGDLNGAANRLLQLRTLTQNQYDLMETPQGFRNIMPKPFAAAVVNLIQSQPSDGAVTQFEALRDQLGDYAPRFIEELRKAGLKPEYVRGLYTNNAATRQNLAEISDMKEPDLLVDLPKTTKTDVTEQIAKALSNSGYKQTFLRGSAGEGYSIYQQQFEVVRKYAIYKIASGKDINEAVKESISELLPEADAKQIVNRTQANYIIPVDPNLNPSTIDKNVRRLLSEQALAAFEVETIDFPDLPEFADEPVTLAAISSNGIWLNNESGDGLRLHYLINDEPIVVKNKDRKYVEIKFKDINSIVREIFPKTSAEERREARKGPAQEPSEEIKITTPIEKPKVSRREGRK